MENVSPSFLEGCVLSCVAMYIFECLAWHVGRKRHGHSFGVCISSGSCLQGGETDCTVQRKGLVGGCGETGECGVTGGCGKWAGAPPMWLDAHAVPQCPAIMKQFGILVMLSFLSQMVWTLASNLLDHETALTG